MTLGILLDQQRLQLRHLLPWSEAGQVLRFVETELFQRHQVAFLPSTIWPDSLMIKLAGMMAGSINFKNFASRVGSQCLVAGVNLQTSNMLVRCLAL